MSHWTRCGCGHIAQDHNRAMSNDGTPLGPDTVGQVSGKPRGYWTNEDIDACRYGCDQCECTNYDGKEVP